MEETSGYHDKTMGSTVFNGEQHRFNPQTWSSKQQKQQKLVDTLW